MNRRGHRDRTAIVSLILVVFFVTTPGARARDLRAEGGNDQLGVFDVGVSFTGGPFFVMGNYAKWLGFQVDLEPRLAMVEGKKITRHVRLRASNEVVFPNSPGNEDRYLPAYRPSVGIMISDERTNSGVLPFFTARGGVQIWPKRTPTAAGAGDITHVDVTPYFPIGGGIEFPRHSRVMAHIELEAVFPEALWFLFPTEYFGWLPIRFEIGVVFQL